MWNRRNEERGSGGPVLRDPLANRNRPQPYNSNSNFTNRQQDYGNNQNFSRGNTNPFIGDQSQFPPVHDEELFPPAPAPFFQKPTPPAQVLLGSLLGRYPSLPAPNPLLDANVRGSEPAVPRFHGLPVQSQFVGGNRLESASIQNAHATSPPFLLAQGFQNPLGLLSLPLSGMFGFKTSFGSNLIFTSIVLFHCLTHKKTTMTSIL